MNNACAPPRTWAAVLIAGLGLLALGASTPEIVRARVPASKVTAWFPAGTDIRVLAPEQFEDLVAAARSRPDRSKAPRVLRVRHSARWVAGSLRGRSEVAIDRSTPTSGLILLEPWSPAVMSPSDRTPFLRATPDGRLGLAANEETPATVAFDWQLRSRPGTEGFGFSLDVPDLELSSLVLDLPSHLIPESDRGTRVGPETGGATDRSAWRFDGARGHLNLQLQALPGANPRPDGPKNWLEGPTRIDLNASPTNWRAEWSIESSPGASDRLVIDLDPGLELVEVSGPRVASFRVEPNPAGCRLSIRLAKAELGSVTPLILRGNCLVPSEGAWAIPSARPVEAIWTGGRTSVRIDPSRLLQGCVERSGRRVSPREGDPSDPSALVFEAEGKPGPVAELSLRKPSADATVEIQGCLKLDQERPEIEVAVSWTIERGQLFAHSVDLAPGWVPDRVATPDRRAVRWHAEPLSRGGMRIHLDPSPLDMELKSLTVLLSATMRRSGPGGPIDLPRVRPAPGSGKVSEETWVAPRIDHLTVRPIQARGLAWIDPPSPSSDPSRPSPWTSAKLRGGLAWRWLLDDAEGRIQCTEIRAKPRVQTRLDASIVAGRLRLDWSIAIDPAASGLDSIPIHVDAEMPGSPIWQSADSSGPIILARDLTPSERTAAGFPGAGSAWELGFSKVLPRPFVLKGRVDLPWSGAGAMPMLIVPGRFQGMGQVSIEVEEATRCRIESDGPTRIERLLMIPDPADIQPATGGEPGPRLRRAGLFKHGPTGGRIMVTTTAGGVTPTGGLIREASLVSQAFSESGQRHRLTLDIHANASRSIELTLPPDLILDRVRRDGQPVAATPSGRSIVVALPTPTASRQSCLLTLDYRSPARPGSGLHRLDANLPTCSLPCLSFVWEVATPDSWNVLKATPELADTDPRPGWTWQDRLFGRGWGRPRGEIARTLPAEREAVFRDLDQLPGNIKDGDASLGDWLLRLDAGRWPLVVDRLALLGAGLGPKSHLGSPLPNAKSSASSFLILQALGLTVEPAGSTLLITTSAEALARASATSSSSWSDLVRVAAAEGADPSERYQAVERWAGEATPRALAAGDAMDRTLPVSGWRVHRYTAAGWPAEGLHLLIDEHRTGHLRGWVLALLILTIAVFARDAGWRARSAGGASILGVAAILLAGSWPESSEAALGLIRGVIAALIFRIGRGIIRRTRGVGSSPITPFGPRIPHAPAVRTASLLLAGMGLALAGSAIGGESERPILALFPEDLAPAANFSPTRVLMRLDDFDRLRELASPPEALPEQRAFMTSAEHRVDREGPDLAVVVSRYGIEVVGDGPTSWSLPIGQALDLSAKVDDRSVPLNIAPDASKASIALAGPGVHRVAFRRLVRLEAIGDEGRRARVAINRSAFARVLIGRQAGMEPIGLPGAEGPVDVRDDQTEGLLGPAGELEVRWGPEGRDPVVPIPWDVDALILWDATPLGDVVRARLTHNRPEPLTSIRLAAEPGVQARSFAIPGVSMIQQAGATDPPEWVVAIDPPLPRGVPFEVEFWRTSGGGSGTRSIPRFRCIGTRHFRGALGFRRSSDWSGRLEPLDALPAPEEAEFARAWGRFAGSGLTLAGTAKFDAFPEVVATIGLAGRSRSIRSELRCELGPGRLAATLDAVLSDREGRSFDVEVGLPTDFRIIELEAQGLVDWQRSARDRVRLQFNGTEIRDRRIHIEGSIRAPAETMMSETRSYAARIPWPRWYGVESESGQLSLSCPNRFSFEPDARDAARSTLGPSAGAGYRAAYRVDRPEGMGPVRWSSPTSLVGVSVQSDLAIVPDAVTWTAVVHCEISGGPAETLHWRLPSEWAEKATLEVDGEAARPGADVKGETTFWTITPATPAWGHARLVLRSTRPLVPGQAFAFPEIAPLSAPGRGTLDRYDLAIANLTSRTLEVAGSAGLQATDVSQYRAEEPGSPAGSIDRAYHVIGDRWSLQVRLGEADGSASPGGEEAMARVESANFCVTLMPSRAAWGCARYDLAPRSGPFLDLSLPAGDEILWATVDGSRVAALRDRDREGRWSIPLGDRAARSIELCWSTPARPGPALWPRALSVPTLIQGGVPMTIQVFGPAEVSLASPLGTVIRMERPGLRLANAGRLAGRIVAAMADLDRGSASGRLALVEDLTRFELCGRAIERAISTRNPANDPPAGRFALLRTSVEEAGQDAGLEDTIEDARILVGLLPPGATPILPGPRDILEPLRVRHIGQAWDFRTASSGGGRPIDLAYTVRTAPTGWGRFGLRAIAGSAFASAAALILGFPRSRPRRPRPRS